MNKSDYIYLDHAATTPMREVAFEAYKKTEMDAYGNSSGGSAIKGWNNQVNKNQKVKVLGYF